MNPSDPIWYLLKMVQVGIPAINRTYLILAILAIGRHLRISLDSDLCRPSTPKESLQVDHF